MKKRQQSETGSAVNDILVPIATVLGMFLAIAFVVSMFVSTFTSRVDDTAILAQKDFNSKVLLQIENNPTFTSFNDDSFFISDIFMESDIITSSYHKWAVTRSKNKLEFETVDYDWKTVTLSGNWKVFTIKHTTSRFKAKNYTYVLTKDGSYKETVIEISK